MIETMENVLSVEVPDIKLEIVLKDPILVTVGTIIIDRLVNIVVIEKEIVIIDKVEESNPVQAVDLIVLPLHQKVKNIWKNPEKDLLVVADLPVIAKIEKIINKLIKEIIPDPKVSKIKVIIIDLEAEVIVNKIINDK